MGKLSEKEYSEMMESIRNIDFSKGLPTKKINKIIVKYANIKNDKPYICAECWNEIKEQQLKIIVREIENWKDMGVTKKEVIGVCKKCAEDKILWDKVKGEE